MPGSSAVILSAAKSLSAILSTSPKQKPFHNQVCRENVPRLHHGECVESALHRRNRRSPASRRRAQAEEGLRLYGAIQCHRTGLLRGVLRCSPGNRQRKANQGLAASEENCPDRIFQPTVAGLKRPITNAKPGQSTERFFAALRMTM
jgi:hypothetical protein